MNLEKQAKDFLGATYENIKWINDSKVFAGIVILMLNVSSKFTTVPIGRVMESYLKHTFSKYMLVFAISWMGTRDVFVALFMTFLFAVVMGMLLNEESPFCCMTEGFTTDHLALLEEDGDSDVLTKQEIESAMKTLEKAQKIMKNSESNEKHTQFLNVTSTTAF
jgi:hypothetical protein